MVLELLLQFHAAVWLLDFFTPRLPRLLCPVQALDFLHLRELAKPLHVLWVAQLRQDALVDIRKCQLCLKTSELIVR